MKFPLLAIAAVLGLALGAETVSAHPPGYVYPGGYYGGYRPHPGYYGGPVYGPHVVRPLVVTPVVPVYPVTPVYPVAPFGPSYGSGVRITFSFGTGFPAYGYRRW